MILEWLGAVNGGLGMPRTGRTGVGECRYGLASSIRGFRDVKPRVDEIMKNAGKKARDAIRLKQALSRQYPLQSTYGS